jgi:hypothetical protein
VAPGHDRQRIKAHYDGIVAFSQTDFTEDLKKITSRCWCCTATTTRSCRIADSAPAVRQAAAQNGKLKTYRLPARHADHPRGRHQRRHPGLHRGAGYLQKHPAEYADIVHPSYRIALGI